MRAARIHEPGGPEVIRIEDTPAPEPGAGEVRIRIAYAALNPLDTHARANRIDWMHPGFPFTPGFEYAGRVEAVGPDGDPALVGRRVACNGLWGGNADYAVAAADRLVPVPEAFDWHTAAAFSTCAYTAWLLVHSAGKVQPGQVVAIHSAAGAVGALTTQVAKAAGATVIALAGGPDKVAYALTFGADHGVDYLEDDWPEHVKRLGGERGADVIIDGNAGPGALKNLDAIAPLGNLIFMGATAGVAPDINVSRLIGACCSVTGFVQYVHQAVSGGAEIEAMNAALADGRFRIPVERVMDLEDLAEAHRAWEARELTGRTLIRAGGEI
ncbi:MAG: zinc-binding dehydrogenase [Xanthomonadales bacterium]|jgi:NADPH2:quinone reductase|nr:zinc-binding dehydrogenase [Xanthomonadales bacterium]